MTDPAPFRMARPLRFVALANFSGTLALAGALALLAGNGRPVAEVPAGSRRALVLAWVALTTVCSILAYRIAARGDAPAQPLPEERRERAFVRRFVLVLALADLPALFGIALFLLLHAWAVLPVALATSLLGTILALPRPDRANQPGRPPVPR